MLSVGTSGPSHPIFIYQVKQSDHDVHVDEFINKEKKKVKRIVNMKTVRLPNAKLKENHFTVSE